MSIYPAKLFSALFISCLIASLVCGYSVAETLNPEGINPHIEAPRKRITQEQKQAAADAIKKRKEEIKARKAAMANKKVSEQQRTATPVSAEPNDNNNK